MATPDLVYTLFRKFTLILKRMRSLIFLAVAVWRGMPRLVPEQPGSIRVLALVATHNRARMGRISISSIIRASVPAGCQLVIVDDGSSSWDPAREFDLPVIHLGSNYGANGSALARLMIGFRYRRYFDYVYLFDSDIYHPVGFWSELSAFLVQHRPEVSSAIEWAPKYHQSRIVAGVRYDQTVAGAALLIRSDWIARATWVALRYSGGNHGWDWGITDRLLTKAKTVSPIGSLAQHLGNWDGLHVGDVLGVNYIEDRGRKPPPRRAVQLVAQEFAGPVLLVAPPDAEVVRRFKPTLVISPDADLCAQMIAEGFDCWLEWPDRMPLKSGSFKTAIVCDSDEASLGEAARICGPAGQVIVGS